MKHLRPHAGRGTKDHHRPRRADIGEQSIHGAGDQGSPGDDRHIAFTQGGASRLGGQGAIPVIVELKNIKTTSGFTQPRHQRSKKADHDHMLLGLDIDQFQDLGRDHRRPFQTGGQGVGRGKTDGFRQRLAKSIEHGQHFSGRSPDQGAGLGLLAATPRTGLRRPGQPRMPIVQPDTGVPQADPHISHPDAFRHRAEQVDDPVLN